MEPHDMAETDAEIMVALGEDYPELRHAVRRICEKFPGEYWRDLDSRSGYPSEFVAALTEAGFLGALIPESYGGSGLPLRAAAVILEEINASGCTASHTASTRITAAGPATRPRTRGRSRPAT